MTILPIVDFENQAENETGRLVPGPILFFKKRYMR